MNMQALLKQAQNMQREILKEKEAINKTTFIGKNGVVTIEINGKKEILKVTIADNNIISDDSSILEDMILLAVNDALKKVDDKTEKELGKYSNAMPGLF